MALYKDNNLLDLNVINSYYNNNLHLLAAMDGIWLHMGLRWFVGGSIRVACCFSGLYYVPQGLQ